MLVKDAMTKYVITLSPEETIRDASEKFAMKNISGAPVVDESGKVVGILSEADILHMLGTYYTQNNVVFLPTPFDLIEIPFRQVITFTEAKVALEDISKKKVKEIMKKNVITVTSDAPVEYAAELMIEKKVNRLPVIEKEKLFGIITRGDIIKVLAERKR